MSILLNGNELSENITIASVQFSNAKKNQYLTSLGGALSTSRIPGSIKVKGSLIYANDAEKLQNLNALESKLADGTLEYDGKEYSVKVSQGLYQGMDFSNITLVFSWDGYAFQNNVNTDLAI